MVPEDGGQHTFEYDDMQRKFVVVGVLNGTGETGGRKGPVGSMLLSVSRANLALVGYGLLPACLPAFMLASACLL